LKEISIPIQTENYVDFFGINDLYLDLIRSKFPELKIVARGNELKAYGSEDRLKLFHVKLDQILAYFEKYGNLSENQIEEIMESPSELSMEKTEINQSDIIVYGQNGLVVKARTANQRIMVNKCYDHDVVFAIGPAGTGKTYTAVALAVRALKNKETKRIILTRPAVEAGENLGFLPGDLKEKIDPYLRPLYDALYDMLPPEKLRLYIDTGVIEIAPLAFMRGRTLNNAFVILDEAQNATQSQLKMFLTRMGPTAKLVVTGDITQVDLPHYQPSGLIQASKILAEIKGICFVYLDKSDVVRHKLVKEIIEAYEHQADTHVVKTKISKK
jgi:phosphate starvation-inducible protein PhoH and related proteins